MFWIAPAEMMRLTVQSALMLAEAQAVMAMRLMGMAGFWNTAPSETSRMVSEKAAATLAAGHAVATAAAAGAAPAQAAMAAIKPVRARTRANAARLARRGPRLPGVC